MFNFQSHYQKLCSKAPAFTRVSAPEPRKGGFSKGGLCRGAKLGLFGFLAVFPKFKSRLGGG